MGQELRAQRHGETPGNDKNADRGSATTIHPHDAFVLNSDDFYICCNKD